jgi:hypothetical protein
MYISEHVKEADVFDDVYIDTNSEEVAEYANSMGFKVGIPADLNTPFRGTGIIGKQAFIFGQAGCLACRTL